MKTDSFRRICVCCVPLLPGHLLVMLCQELEAVGACGVCLSREKAACTGHMAVCP